MKLGPGDEVSNGQGDGIPGGQNCRSQSYENSFPVSCTPELRWVTEDPEEGGVEETLQEALAWVLTFWVGVPSTRSRNPTGEQIREHWQVPLGLLIAQGCELSCSPMRRGPWYIHMGQLRLQIVRWVPSNHRSPCS